MKIAYTSTFDSRDVHNWSGTPFHMSRAFAALNTDVQYVGSLKNQRPPFFKLKQTYQKLICNQRMSPRFNIHVAKKYSEAAASQLAALNVDVIVSPLVNPIAYLDTSKPIVLWTDAVYAALLGFYPPFNYHSAQTIREGNEITKNCLDRVSLAIFSSEWAAQSAIQLYGVAKEKVRVAPFGANIENFPDENEIKNIIRERDQKKIKLLFLAKSWERKGGDVVLNVAKALYEAGYPVELTIVGYQPPDLKHIPPYVKALGFISKHTPEGKARLQTILKETHFLFVPSRAEAYGIVFCEANAYAVPCLTTYVGGIGTIVKDHVNGMTFGLDASVEKYSDYILDLMQNREKYAALCMTSYQEFATRLNWKSSATQVKNWMEALL